MTNETTPEMPEEPETETHEHVADDGGTEVRFTFRADPDRGKIAWTASWNDTERSGYTDELSEKHGAIIYPRSPRINGEKTQGSKIDQDLFETLKDELAAVQQYREEKREAERNAKLSEDLTLTVEEHTWKSGTHRTKYTRNARVLMPRKGSQYWTDDESEMMAALTRELGEADGKPEAEGDENPFADVDEGETFTLEEAADRVDGVDSALEQLAAEREAEQAREELVSDHPALRGTGVEPTDVQDAFEEASETGEPVTVATGSDYCDGSVRECSLDRLTYRATPDGDIDVKRTHTY